MTSAQPPDLTQLLSAASGPNADPGAAERLFAAVQRELRGLASGLMHRERPGHTLQPTALVNEAYLRLVGATDLRWEDRAHFFGVAARAMRQVLVDHARERAAAKRGGGWERVTLDERLNVLARADVDLFELDDALDRLAEKDARAAQVVELRFFGGLTEDEIAHVLDLSRRTVQREWWFAKMWLRHAMSDEPGGRPDT